MTEVLHDKAKEYDLEDGNLTLQLGYVTFQLLRCNGDMPGVIFREDHDKNVSFFQRMGVSDRYERERPETDYFPKGILLYPGESAEIGRKTGVKIITRGLNSDPERTSLYDWEPFLSAMKADEKMSRSHALVMALEPWTVKVRDLGSTNGTLVGRLAD
jgi:hypothetical protein